MKTGLPLHKTVIVFPGLTELTSTSVLANALTEATEFFYPGASSWLREIGSQVGFNFKRQAPTLGENLTNTELSQMVSGDL